MASQLHFFHISCFLKRRNVLLRHNLGFLLLYHFSIMPTTELTGLLGVLRIPIKSNLQKAFLNWEEENEQNEYIISAMRGVHAWLSDVISTKRCQVCVISLISQRLRNRCSQTFSDLSSVTQIVCGRAGFENTFAWCHSFFPHSLFPLCILTVVTIFKIEEHKIL